MAKKLKIQTKRNVYKERVVLDEKIKIFEKSGKTGKDIKNSTVYEGHPIGIWAIQIRNLLNKKKINMTDEQKEVLQSLGILDRKYDKSIDEKIEELVKWNDKYPNAMCKKGNPDQEDIAILVKYTNMELDRFLQKKQGNISEAEKSKEREKIYKNIYEEYCRMNKYYEYVYHRRLYKKLTPKQEERCKEGKVRGVFGYPKLVEELSQKYNTSCKEMLEFSNKFDTKEQIEHALTSLSIKYKINEDKVAYIVNNYQTVENFIVKYIWDNINDKDFEVLGKNLVGLEGSIDINLKADSNLDKLMTVIRNEGSWHKKLYLSCALYDSEKLSEYINNLEDSEKEIIISRFGLYGEDKKSLEIISKKQNKSRERVRQVNEEIIEKFRLIKDRFQYNFSNIKLEELREEEIQAIASSISKIIFKPDEKYQGNAYTQDNAEIKNLLSILSKIDKSIIKFNNGIELDKNSQEMLNKRKTYRQNYNDFIDDEEIEKRIEQIKNDWTLGIRDEEAKKFIARILEANKEKIMDNIINNAQQKDEIVKESLLNYIRNIPLAEIDLSKRTFGGLQTLNIRTIGDLKTYTSGGKGIGEKSTKEINQTKEKFETIVEYIGIIFEQKTHKIQTELSIEEIGLPAGIKENFLKANINTIGDLQWLLYEDIDEDLKEIVQNRIKIVQGIGEDSLQELKKVPNGVKECIKEKMIDELYKKEIEGLNLSIREYRSLKMCGINTYGELEKLNMDELSKMSKMRNVGSKTIREIEEKIQYIRQQNEYISTLFIERNEEIKENNENHELSELEMLKEQKNELKKQEEILRYKVKDAEALSKSYDEILGEQTYSINE